MSIFDLNRTYMQLMELNGIYMESGWVFGFFSVMASQTL